MPFDNAFLDPPVLISRGGRGKCIICHSQDALLTPGSITLCICVTNARSTAKQWQSDHDLPRFSAEAARQHYLNHVPDRLRRMSNKIKAMFHITKYRYDDDDSKYFYLLVYLYSRAIDANLGIIHKSNNDALEEAIGNITPHEYSIVMSEMLEVLVNKFYQGP